MPRPTPDAPDTELLDALAAAESARRRATARTFGLLVGGPVLLFVGVIAAVLVACAETPRGVAMGVAFAPPCFAGLTWLMVGRAPLRSALGLGAAAFGYACIAAPDGDVRTTLRDGPGVQSLWFGTAGFSRFGLANLTPERDQARLATWLLPAVDPLLSYTEAARFRDATSAVYAELDATPGMAALGSVQGLAYDELLGGTPRPGHAWVDLADAAGPRPAIVFLHGFGGNLLGYTWVLREAAHRHGYAIVAPTFGAGLWYRPDAQATVDTTLAWMASTGRFVMDRLVVVGLSNGGFGATGAVLAGPVRWRGAAWLSGVLDADAMPQLATAVRAHPMPLLVLHGAHDDRVPLDYVRIGVDTLERGGVPVDLDVVDDADHFLAFTHRARVDAAFDRWLTAVDAAP